MRMLVLLPLLFLTGCYCMLDPGDKRDSNYLHNCWAAAAGSEN